MNVMLKMVVGAAGFSSTWNLIDPLIAGIGHRVKTPALPPAFPSDGNMPLGLFQKPVYSKF